MKFFRYRRPSLKTMLGITKAKKRIKKELGITAFMKPFRWWTNTKRRIKQQDWVRVESRQADSEWIAKARRMLVCNDRRRGFGDGGNGLGEVTPMPVRCLNISS